MTNKPSESTKIPKLPPLNFGAPKVSMFGGNRGFMPKGNPKAKFGKVVFQTQHKGGPSGGK
jgi:hypothetical protein